MNKTTYYIFAAILLLAIALIPAGQVTHFLVPGIGQASLPAIDRGVLVFKILLYVDIALLLVAAYIHFRRAALTTGNAYRALWHPVIPVDGYWSDNRRYRIAFVFILFVATVLRIPSLNSDLWIDEVLTLVNFVRLPIGQIITDFSSDNQHLFFSFLSHISISIFGESPWSVRLPSLLFGIASIGLGMQLAKLVYGRRVAIFTGLLLTLSYHHIWFSQNARGYAILLFGTVFSTYLLLRALQTGRWRYWVVYALVIALSAWAHITAAFVSVAHALVVLVLVFRSGAIQKTIWLPLAGFVFTLWLTLHFYALILPQMIDFFTQPGAGTGTVKTEWRSPLWLFTETFRSLGISAAIGWLGTSLFLASGVIALYWYVKRDWVFVALALLPGVLLGVSMFALGRNLWPRMFYNEIGFFMILISVGALATGSYLRKKLYSATPRALETVPVLVIAVIFALGLPDLYRYPKQDFSGARDYVRKHMQAGDRVLGLQMAGRMYQQYYARDWTEINSLDELKQNQSKQGHTWVIYTLPRFLKQTMPAVMQTLEQEYTVMKVFPGTLGDGYVIVCRSKQGTR